MFKTVPRSSILTHACLAIGIAASLSFLSALSAQTLPDDVHITPQTGRQSKVDSDKRSEEHTSELQSHLNLVCRLLLEKKTRVHAPQAITGERDPTSLLCRQNAYPTSAPIRPAGSPAESQRPHPHTRIPCSPSLPTFLL